LAEEPVLGVWVGRAGDRVAPRLPSRALSAGRCGGLPGVSLEAGEDGVADPPLQGPECLFVGLSLGELAVVAGLAVVVPVPDLGDRGHARMAWLSRRFPRRDGR
jgi:hypothetical protein